MKRLRVVIEPDNNSISEATILGGFIRSSRARAGLTLEEAALTIGIAKQTLADIETGKNTVSFGIVMRVVEALGLCLFVVDKRDKTAVLDVIRARKEQRIANGVH